VAASLQYPLAYLGDQALTLLFGFVDVVDFIAFYWSNRNVTMNWDCDGQTKPKDKPAMDPLQIMAEGKLLIRLVRPPNSSRSSRLAGQTWLDS
jgi:hypothetical protein